MTLRLLGAPQTMHLPGSSGASNGMHRIVDFVSSWIRFSQAAAPHQCMR
jgi:hypothetical protein